MPAQRAAASLTPTVVAPDGIAIHTFDLTPATFGGVAEGRIPPGSYGIHRHRSLEQYTYVVTGAVVAVTQAPDAAYPTEVELTAGDLLLTLPGETLQFINRGTAAARVLFFCAPPYPVDDADTQTLAGHTPPAPADIAAMRTRLEAIRAAFNRAVDARLAQLEETSG